SVLPEKLNGMVMVDIANPRDIEERVADLGVRLYNIDDLRGIANKNRKMREGEAKAAAVIIEDELNLLKTSLKHREAEPIISRIRKEAEEIRMRETEKALKIMGDVNGQEKVVENLTKILVDRIFSDVIENIKDAAEQEDKDVLKAAKCLFTHNNN
ncbi:MAG: glutamyl-tRNA reductase, partial [Methanobacteriaceae archaeon]|nr:glutamyl-tRNA reductase [Methanobacteriaceae archaeon]